MIRISSLWSLSEVSDIYFITDDLNVINSVNGHILSVCKNYRGYPYVTLQRKDKSRTGMKVPMHKLVALAFIRNEAYEVIEHIDDNRENYHPTNLKFSTQTDNIATATNKNAYAKREEIFRVELHSGRVFEGTMLELTACLSIPRGTLYSYLYKNSGGKIVKSIMRTGKFLDPLK